MHRYDDMVDTSCIMKKYANVTATFPAETDGRLLKEEHVTKLYHQVDLHVRMMLNKTFA